MSEKFYYSKTHFIFRLFVVLPLAIPVLILGREDLASKAISLSKILYTLNLAILIFFILRFIQNVDMPAVTLTDRNIVYRELSATKIVEHEANFMQIVSATIEGENPFLSWHRN